MKFFFVASLSLMVQGIELQNVHTNVPTERSSVIQKLWDIGDNSKPHPEHTHAYHPDGYKVPIVPAK